MKKINTLRIAFFGTGPLAEEALVASIEKGLVPALVVTKEDAPIGRHQSITPPSIKIIATAYGIPVFQKKQGDLWENSPLYDETPFDLFIVASYGVIIREQELDLPLYGVLNIHPSLLPQYRGPTPIETALYNNDKTMGITIMALDTEVDHGPIVVQRSYDILSEYKEETALFFEAKAGALGMELLYEILPSFISGAISVEEQNHKEATYTKKFTKEMGLVDIVKDSRERIMAVYRSCTPWPGCYFMFMHNGRALRIKITEMAYIEGVPTIMKVIPEGKKEMSFAAFKNGYKQ